MFSKLFNFQSQNDLQKGETLADFNPQVIVHYGIPSAASRLAYDPVQQLLAVGTLDGRIKVIGSHSIEGLLTSPKELPFKDLEFLQNQGFLVAVSTENDVQVWDLEHRCMAYALQWKSNITAFAVIQETSYMYLGDENGQISVLKYDVEERKLLEQPYSITTQSLCEAAGFPLLSRQSIVGILPQPCSRGNRLLFAYDNGIIVLWDISKDQLLFIRGSNNCQMNDGTIDISENARSITQKDRALGHEQEEKEITSLCWASSDGSILAVGYVDGDIMFWNFSGAAMTNEYKTGKPADIPVKLQLSSANRRFPVIVLHWSARGLQNEHGGQLFVYGGDEIGSPEVLTILSLEWSPKRDSLKNVKRVNITLQGSFAHMILLQSFSVLDNAEGPSVFILSSPGQLQYYDSSCLSGLISHQDKSSTVPVFYRSVVPTTEPYLTVGRLISLHGNTECSVALSKMAASVKFQETYLSYDESSKWPLNGGVPCHLPPIGERNIERLYIAGYQDGLVRIWDATYPTLSYILILKPEIRGVAVADSAASVSALDFSSETISIAVGSNNGVVRVYNLSGNRNEARLHVVTETKIEVHDLEQGDGSLLSSIFKLSISRVCALKYTKFGTRLAVGYESGQVAMLDVNSFSVFFLMDALTTPSSPVTSFASTIFLDSYGLKTSSDQSVPQGQSEPTEELIFVFWSDFHVAVLDGSTGNVFSCFPKNHNQESAAISVYILEGSKCISEVASGKYMNFLSQEGEAKAELTQLSGRGEGSSDGVDRSNNIMQPSGDLQILLCCTDVLQMYSLKSAIQGQDDSINEVNLPKISCWTSTFKKEENECGLIILYQTGSIEIRSLPNLEVLREVSLMSIMRWNMKANIDKTTSCTESGQITLVNGSEFAVVSLFARKNVFRIPQSLPCLHDKVLAAALDLNSPNQNKNKQEPTSGILGGIMRGLRASKESQHTNPVEDQKLIRSTLDKIFSRSTEDSSTATKVVDGVVELNIDDIDIDGPLRISPIAQKRENENKDKKAERKKLFGGATSETKPRQRTVEEIKAKYKRTGDTSSATSAAAAASQAKDKLLERKEKLERISKNSEELSDNAQNFASMAQELAKRMENRKWWQL